TALLVAVKNVRLTSQPSNRQKRRGDWFGRTNPNCASGPPTVARTRTLPLPPCRRGERFGRTNPNCRPRPSGLQVALTNLARTHTLSVRAGRGGERRCAWNPTRLRAAI